MTGDRDRAPRPGERVRLLGEVALLDAAGVRELGHRRQKTVFALLAVQPGTAVAVSRLCEQLWGPRAGRSSRDTLYTYMSRLRKLLSDVDGVGLRRETGGYRLDLDPDAIDMFRFRALAEAAERLPDVAAIRARREALALWRGEPFAGLAAPELVRLRELLVGERFTVELDLHDALLRGGEAAASLPRLRELVARHPLDERLAGQFVRALHATGDSDAALAHFGRLAERLAAERGTAPGAGVAALAERIRGAVAVRARPIPRQLPGDIGGFVGRTADLSRLDALVGRTRVAVVTGTAGVGKTTLANHWAHRAAASFPDGQLYVNLRGYDPSGEPLAVAEVVRGFLAGFGVGGHRLPVEPAAQLDLCRRLLAERRVLVVLDNARGLDQVRPLLPERGSSLVLVTSRGGWPDAATPRIAIDVLDRSTAVELLAHRLGAAAVAADSRATDDLVELCARLPLALSIVAAQAALRHGYRLRDIIAELRGHGEGLSAFDGDEDVTDLRAVFTWSYRELSPAARDLFRALSRNPGPQLSPSAAASLVGSPPQRTADLLRELVDAGLLTEDPVGRYAFHDLLRAFSHGLSEREDPAEVRHGQLDRLLSWAVHSAEAAAGLTNVSRTATVTTPLSPGVTVAAPADAAAAWRWFDAEHAGLVALVRLALAEGRHREVIDLEWGVATYFSYRTRLHGAVTVTEAAIAAARRLGDRHSQARSHRNLARTLANLHRFAAARDQLLAGLDLFDDAAEPLQQGHTHTSLSVLYSRQDRHAEALPHSLRALELHRAADNAVGIAVALNNIGWNRAHLGEPRSALRSCLAALAMYEDLDKPLNRAGVLDSLGYIHARLAEYPTAVSYLRRSARAFAELGHRVSVTESLIGLGDVHRAAADFAAARAAYAEALSILDDIGHPDAESVRARLDALADAVPAAVAGT